RDVTSDITQNRWATSVGWTASIEIGGTPGDGVAQPSVTYARWSAHESVGLPEEDPDRVGAENLVEYALGMNPNFPDSCEMLFVNLRSMRNHLSEHTVRTDVHYILETSANLDEWRTLAEDRGTGTSWIPVSGISFESGTGETYARLRL